MNIDLNSRYAFRYYTIQKLSLLYWSKCLIIVYKAFTKFFDAKSHMMIWPFSWWDRWQHYSGELGERNTRSRSLLSQSCFGSKGTITVRSCTPSSWTRGVPAPAASQLFTCILFFLHNSKWTTPRIPTWQWSHMPPFESLDCLSGNICMLHLLTRPTAHPCTTHRTLLMQSIFTHKRSTHCACKPTHRIFQARLPPSHEHPCQLLPHSNSSHITIMLNIITPQLHSHARASPFCPLNRCARSPIGAARHWALRVFILAGVKNSFNWGLVVPSPCLNRTKKAMWAPIRNSTDMLA
jgi:hypothetical protein